MRSWVSIGLALALGACDGSADTGPTATRDFPASGFDRVTLAGPDDVTVSIGPARVTAEGSEKTLALLKVEVVDGVLRVARTGDTGGGGLFGREGGRAKVRVTMPAIAGANLSGVGKLTVDGPAGAAFDGKVGGAGSLDVRNMKVGTAGIELTGVGSATLAGTTGQARVTLSGAGSVDADGLEARDLSLAVSGVGSVKARATGRVTGDVSGVGSVRVTGTDDCAINKSGVGTVKCGK